MTLAGSFGYKMVMVIASIRGDIIAHQMKSLLKITMKGQVPKVTGGKEVRKFCPARLLELGSPK